MAVTPYYQDEARVSPNSDANSGSESLFADLPRAGEYRTIVADPPWEYEDGTGASYSTAGRRNCDLPYPSMTVDEIAALPVRECADRRSTLFLWTTNRYLADAYEIAAAWGFPVIAVLVWCKQRGLGSGGVFYSNVEFCLYCRRPQVAAPARIHSRWFDWSRGQHSAKPEAFLDMVEEVSPGPYLELFSRRARFGWDVWGNEALTGGEAVTKSGIAA